jgi:glycosyltransferase involved in cell wall biosynthesis
MRLLFLDRSTRLRTVSDLLSRARGGMVSSLFHVTDYLASQGHDVTVLSDIESTGATKAGTKWLHEAWGEYDCLICNRGVGDGYPQIRAKKRVLWTHDLPHSGFIPEPKTIRAFDRVVFMSRYAERVWRAFYRDIGRSTTIPNGVDKRLFYPREKDLDTIIYASAPNRGLDRLPLILDAIRSRVGREIRLRAYSNLAALHPGEVGTGDGFDYGAVRDSSVDLCDPVPQDELAGIMGQAGLMILPSGYPEICSNAVLQALASGVPIITTGRLGATPEWVRHGWNGLLTRFQPHDYMIYTVETVRHAVRVLERPSLHRRLMFGARHARVFSWQEIGSKWATMFRSF